MPDFADRRSRISEAGKPVTKRVPESRQAVPVAIGQMTDPAVQRPGTGMREALRTIDQHLQRGFRDLESKLQPGSSTQQPTAPGSRLAAPPVTSAAAVQPARNAPTAPGAKTPITPPVRTISNVSSPAPAAKERPIPAAVPKATIADQRAYYQYASARAPKHEADATRLAKVTEADELIKQGKMAPDKQVQQWATEIRSGNTRKVADLSPQAVNEKLQSAAGGREAAKVLNTSRVAQIEGEHQTRAQSLQARLAEKRKAVDRYGLPPTEAEESQRAGKLLQIREFSKAQPASLNGDFVSGKGLAVASPHSRMHHEETSAPTRSAPSMQNQSLTSMMRHNDIAHENMAVAGLESSMGQRSESLTMKKETKQKIGQVLSPMSMNRAGTQSLEQKKAPWGEGREMRQMIDMMGTLIDEVKRSYT